MHLFLSYRSSERHSVHAAHYLREALSANFDVDVFTDREWSDGFADSLLRTVCTTSHLVVIWSPAMLKIERLGTAVLWAAKRGRYLGLVPTEMPPPILAEPYIALSQALTNPFELCRALAQGAGNRVPRRALRIASERWFEQRATALQTGPPRPAPDPHPSPERRSPNTGSLAAARIVNRTEPLALVTTCRPHRAVADSLAAHLDASLWMRCFSEWSRPADCPVVAPDLEDFLADGSDNIVVILWSFLAVQSNHVRRLASASVSRGRCFGILYDDVSIPQSVGSHPTIALREVMRNAESLRAVIESASSRSSGTAHAARRGVHPYSGSGRRSQGPGTGVEPAKWAYRGTHRGGAGSHQQGATLATRAVVRRAAEFRWGESEPDVWCEQWMRVAIAIRTMLADAPHQPGATVFLPCTGEQRNIHLQIWLDAAADTESPVSRSPRSASVMCADRSLQPTVGALRTVVIETLWHRLDRARDWFDMSAVQCEQQSWVVALERRLSGRQVVFAPIGTWALENGERSAVEEEHLTFHGFGADGNHLPVGNSGHTD